jgi:hypothetical protein
VRRAKANATTKVVVEDIRRSGVETLAGIAKVLEAREVRPPAGRSTWQPSRYRDCWSPDPGAARLLLPPAISVEGVDVGTVGVPFISVRVDLGEFR